jgi:hypothetical protein
MADSLWVSIVEAVGIGGSLVYYGITCQQQANAQKEQAEAQKQQARAQETQNLMALNERHRSFWRDAYHNPELQRVFSADANAESLSIVEEEFINEVIVFYEISWRIAENSYQSYLPTLARDIARFLSFPLPAVVWKKITGRDEPFVKFVERALSIG